MTFVEKHVDQELMMGEIERSMDSFENKLFFFVQSQVSRMKGKKRMESGMGIKKKMLNGDSVPFSHYLKVSLYCRGIEFTVY